MKLISAAFATFAFLAAAVNGSPMMRQEAEGGNPAQQQQQSSNCNLTGTYKKGTDISACSTVTVGPLSVPAGVTLDLSRAKAGATIRFTGTTTFGTLKWNGPLVTLSGTDLKVKGNGKLDGQGAWYWKQGQSTTRPVFFQVHKVIDAIWLHHPECALPNVQYC
ncbi:hypothetical protein PF005_g29947 [Phytophthora fragariae]|uniref:Pectate lyase n=1 Tax=Phytophthora fragariae TaxID=53985 RepID=A0A6A3PRE7_9STRA|nr:hypothetical protein PF011_g29231 [Phytophthora fragariae]KAE9059144.1 hypothetical protein PF010_g30741 [Phytophthora fragariae]KAE9060033.1 hypothetical protein PF007_g30746 [Phytophthora fragariae]KAE9068855.1 hypothetical protein PF006_g29703 [Phytophthora fragariae]KAE9164624.1 hypothetical protein PF005_g29947 [Phytophthora fragariae]